MGFNASRISFFSLVVPFAIISFCSCWVRPGGVAFWIVIGFIAFVILVRFYSLFTQQGHVLVPLVRRPLGSRIGRVACINAHWESPKCGLGAIALRFRQIRGSSVISGSHCGRKCYCGDECENKIGRNYNPGQNCWHIPPPPPFNVGQRSVPVEIR